MKLATFFYQGVEKVGVLTPDGQKVCPLGAFGFDCPDMLSAIKALDKQTVAGLTARLAAGEAPEALPLDTVKLLAPIPRPAQDVTWSATSSGTFRPPVRPSPPSILPSGWTGLWTRRGLWTAIPTWFPTWIMRWNWR